MFLFLTLWLNKQQHGSIPGNSQRLFSNNLAGTRRSSTSFLDTLQRRADLQDFLERLHYQAYSCPKPEASSRYKMDQLWSTSTFAGSSSFANDDQETDISKDSGALEHTSEQVKMNSQSMSFGRRNSDVPPHSCQACRAMLLGVRSGGRGSLGHASSSHIHQNMPTVSPFKPPFSPDPAYLDSIYMTQQSPHISALPPKHVSVPKNISTSIPVQVTPPSPVHEGHPAAQVPVTALHNMSSINHTTAFSPVYITIPSPVHTSSRHTSISSPVDLVSPWSSSPVSPISLIGPHSPSLGDSSDLFHLDRCLHHIINHRTSSPVLADRAQPGDGHSDASINRFLGLQFQAKSSLCVPISHQETSSFSVQGSEVGPGLVVGENKMS